MSVEMHTLLRAHVERINVSQELRDIYHPSYKSPRDGINKVGKAISRAMTIIADIITTPEIVDRFFNKTTSHMFLMNIICDNVDKRPRTVDRIHPRMLKIIQRRDIPIDTYRHLFVPINQIDRPLPEGITIQSVFLSKIWYQIHYKHMENMKNLVVKRLIHLRHKEALNYMRRIKAFEIPSDYRNKMILSFLDHFDISSPEIFTIFCDRDDGEEFMTFGSNGSPSNRWEGTILRLRLTDTEYILKNSEQWGYHIIPFDTHHEQTKKEDIFMFIKKDDEKWPNEFVRKCLAN